MKRDPTEAFAPVTPVALGSVAPSGGYVLRLTAWPQPERRILFWLLMFMFATMAGWYMRDKGEETPLGGVTPLQQLLRAHEEVAGGPFATTPGDSAAKSPYEHWEAVKRASRPVPSFSWDELLSAILPPLAPMGYTLL